MMDDRLRAMGRAARAEVEAGLDLDAELTALHQRAPSDLEPLRAAGGERRARRAAAVWIAVAAATVVVLVGGISFLGDDDGTAIQTAEPETTIDTSVATTAGTSGPTSTAPSAPRGERIGQIRGGPAPSGGRFDAIDGDLIELRSDGTLWLRRDFATDPGDAGVRLLDDRYPLEGVNGVAVLQGTLVWSDCCEPIVGNVWSVDDIDGERALVTYGTLLRLSPEGTTLAMVDGDGAVRFRDLTTLEESSITEGLDGTIVDLQWAEDGSALLVSHDDDGRFLLSRLESPGDPVRTATVSIGEVPESVKTGAVWTSPTFAGANDSVVALVGADPEGLLDFFDAKTLDEIDADHPWDLPAGARSIELAPDGQSLVYVADDGLHRVDGFGTDVLIAGDVTAAWYPSVSDTAPAVPTATTVPSPSTLPTTTVPVTTVPATTAPVPAVDWRDLSYESSGIPNSCVGPSIDCTRIVHATDGTPISYDPAARVLTRHGVPEVSVTLPDSYGPSPRLDHAGPDDVVYLLVEPATASTTSDLVAVSLSDGDAGREIARWNGAEHSSERQVAATRDGLVEVLCCGADPRRPSPDAELIAPWVDRDGNEIVSDAPSIITTVGSEMTITRSDAAPIMRREWTFRPAAEWTGRVTPQVTATFDGGFAAALPTALPEGPGVTIVRGWPDGDVEQRSYLTNDPSVALDRNGRALIGDGDIVWRVDLFDDITTRPKDLAEVDVAAGTVTLRDLSDVAASWQNHPVAFADAVRGPLAVNEQRTITTERRSDVEWVVTVTTSNFLDDSVFADRWELVLNRDEDGRFRFVSGQWSQACQPDRGHQDFSTELCV